MTKKTPLYENHRKLNARFTDFGGWEMPLMYTTVMEEHNAVRNKCGMFDASHMGEFLLKGESAVGDLNKLITCDAGKLSLGRAKYTFFLNESAGIIDDLIIYKKAVDEIFIVVNAGNVEKDYSWLKSRISKSSELSDLSPGTSLIALQGPESEKIVKGLFNSDLSALKYFSFVETSYKGYNDIKHIIARTGYTGEDGFEIFADNRVAPVIWDKLAGLGVKPCGLGARDSLRLEAAMPLHGHDITESTTPIEAGLGWAVYYDHDYIGKDILKKQKENGIDRYLGAFETASGIPREGCSILLKGEEIGSVTSGTFSPVLKKGIALGYINKKFDAGTEVEIVIHGKNKPAKIVKKPFYKRKK